MCEVSKITGGETKPIFKARILGKYDVQYYECRDTGFIQTEEPFWLSEAYSAAITSLDIGLLSRNIQKAKLTIELLEKSFTGSKTYLDFGGGYGIFTRMMRDHGYSFRHFDIHCENLFAKNLDLEQLPTSVDFDVATAWEVMEHIANPIVVLSEIMSCSEAFLFSTELVPRTSPRKAEDWWYFMPETGQHISFYTEKSLRHLAETLDCHFHTDGACNHILSKTKLRINPFAGPTIRSPYRRARNRVGRALLGPPHQNSRTSLLETDFENAARELKKRQSKRSSELTSP